MAIENNVLDAMKTVAQSEVSKVKYDRTIVAEVIGAVENTSNRYWVSNGAVRFQANAADVKSRYSAGQKVYVTIPNDDYSSENKVITGAYSDEDGYQINQSTDPFDLIIPVKSLVLEENEEKAPLSVTYETGVVSEKELDFFYNYIPDISLDYIGVELNISTYDNTKEYNFFSSGEFQFIITFGEDQYNYSSKELIGNPFNLTKEITHKKLFNIIDFDNIKNANTIKLELKIVSLTPEASTFTVDLNKIKIIFGYKKEKIQTSQLNLYDLSESYWAYQINDKGEKESGRTILIGEYINADNNTITTAPYSSDNIILFDGAKAIPTTVRKKPPFDWGNNYIKNFFTPREDGDEDTKYSLVGPYSKSLSDRSDVVCFVKLFKYNTNYKVIDDSNAGPYWQAVGMTGIDFFSKKDEKDMEGKQVYWYYENQNWVDKFRPAFMGEESPTLLFASTLNPLESKAIFKIGMYFIDRALFEWGVTTINKLITDAMIGEEEIPKRFNTQFYDFLTKYTTYIESKSIETTNLGYEEVEPKPEPEPSPDPDPENLDSSEVIYPQPVVQLIGSDDGIYNFYNSSNQIAWKDKLYETRSITTKILNKEYRVWTMPNNLYLEGSWTFIDGSAAIFLNSTGDEFSDSVKKTIEEYLKNKLPYKGLYSDLEDGLKTNVKVNWTNESSNSMIEITKTDWVEEEKRTSQKIFCGYTIPVEVNGWKYNIYLNYLLLNYTVYSPYLNYQIKNQLIEDCNVIKCTINDKKSLSTQKFFDTYSCYFGKVSEEKKYDLQVFFEDKNIHGINVQKQNDTVKVCCSISSSSMEITTNDKLEIANQLKVSAPGFLSLVDDDGTYNNEFFNTDADKETINSVNSQEKWYQFEYIKEESSLWASFLWNSLTTPISGKISAITKIEIQGVRRKEGTVIFDGTKYSVNDSIIKRVFSNLNYTLDNIPSLYLSGYISSVKIYFNFKSLDPEITNNSFYPIKFRPVKQITYDSEKDYFLLGTVYLNNGFEEETNHYYVPLDCMTNIAVLRVLLEDSTTYFPIPVYYYLTRKSSESVFNNWEYDTDNNILLDGSTIITYDVNNNNLKNYIDIPYQIYENGVTKLKITETPEIWDINKNTEKITFFSLASGSDAIEFTIQGVNQNYYQTGTESKVTIHSPFRGYEKTADLDFNPKAKELKIQTLLTNNYYLQLPQYFDFKRKIAIYCLRIFFEGGLWLQPIVIKSENWDNSLVKDWDNTVSFIEETKNQEKTQVNTVDRYLLPSVAAGDKNEITRNSHTEVVYSGVVIGSIFKQDQNTNEIEKEKKGLFCFDNEGYCDLEITTDKFLLGNETKNSSGYISYSNNGLSIKTNKTITSGKIEATTTTTKTINVNNCLITRAPTAGKSKSFDDWATTIDDFFDKIPLKIFTYEDNDYYYMGYAPKDMDIPSDLKPYFQIMNTGLANSAIRYDEFIALNTWQIQKLKPQVNALKTQIETLTDRVAELEQEIKEIKQ